ADERDARRAQLLQQLAASVPYHDAIMAATHKLDHVTAASAAHTAAASFVPAETARGHAPMNGYDVKTVLRDARFRLGLALREAGVAKSGYAHAIVMQLAPCERAPF
ncbi:unnamed protein product, partial [Phaeothamnion confervicola]